MAELLLCWAGMFGDLTFVIAGIVPATGRNSTTVAFVIHHITVWSAGEYCQAYCRSRIIPWFTQIEDQPDAMAARPRSFVSVVAIFMASAGWATDPGCSHVEIQQRREWRNGVDAM